MILFCYFIAIGCLCLVYGVCVIVKVALVVFCVSVIVVCAVWRWFLCDLVIV